MLLDDHFATIVAAVEQGRATFANIRRFLTYHLTDNVAELAPFVVWALTGGRVPLALGVLQVLALDIGTDLLPALALGAEPPNPRTHARARPAPAQLDRPAGCCAGRSACSARPRPLAEMARVPRRAARSAAGARASRPAPALLAAASGAAFAAVVLGQLANAFACRSEHRPVGRWSLRGNRLLLGAVLSSWRCWPSSSPSRRIADVLGHAVPPALGWALAAAGRARGAARRRRDETARRPAAGRDTGRPTRSEDRPKALPAAAPADRCWTHEEADRRRRDDRPALVARPAMPLKEAAAVLAKHRSARCRCSTPTTG